jgi:hypothetical protein
MANSELDSSQTSGSSMLDPDPFQGFDVSIDDGLSSYAGHYPLSIADSDLVSHSSQSRLSGLSTARLDAYDQQAMHEQTLDRYLNESHRTSQLLLDAGNATEIRSHHRSLIAALDIILAPLDERMV